MHRDAPFGEGEVGCDTLEMGKNGEQGVRNSFFLGRGGSIL